MKMLICIAFTLCFLTGCGQPASQESRLPEKPVTIPESAGESNNAESETCKKETETEENSLEEGTATFPEEMSDAVVNQKCNVFEYVYLDSLLALFRISGRMTEEEIQRLETQIRLNQETPVEDLSHTLISGSGYCRVLEEMGIPMYGEEGEENN